MSKLSKNPLAGTPMIEVQSDDLKISREAFKRAYYQIGDGLVTMDDIAEHTSTNDQAVKLADLTKKMVELQVQMMAWADTNLKNWD